MIAVTYAANSARASAVSGVVAEPGWKTARKIRVSPARSMTPRIAAISSGSGAVSPGCQ
jgi:hypothetical protein